MAPTAASRSLNPFSQGPASKTQLVHKVELVGEKFDPPFLVYIHTGRRRIEHGDSGQFARRVLVSGPDALDLGLILIPDPKGDRDFRRAGRLVVVDTTPQVDRAQGAAKLLGDTAIAAFAGGIGAIDESDAVDGKP